MMILAIVILVLALIVACIPCIEQKDISCYIIVFLLAGFGGCLFGAALVKEEPVCKKDTPDIKEIRVLYKNGVLTDSIVIYK